MTNEYVTTYSDITARYTIIYNRGNQYIAISNSIQAIPTKTYNATKIRCITISMLSTLTTSGNQTNIHILGNEASYISKQGLPKNKIKYQLVPPHLHRRNASENVIHKLKANFITCICATDTDYPDKYWDSFLPKATLTLNLILNCNFNPKLSAYADLHCIFDYNKKTSCLS